MNYLTGAHLVLLLVMPSLCVGMLEQDLAVSSIIFLVYKVGICLLQYILFYNGWRS